MIARLVRLCLCCLLVAVACCHAAHALPPLGLTPISPGFGRIEIIDGTAYISQRTGVLTVSSGGVINLIPVLHPNFSTTEGVTRVVEAADGELYVGANFSSNSGLPFGAALFRLDQPSTPIVNYDEDGVQGVGRNLTAYGTAGYGPFVASKFLQDGSTEPLAFPPGADPSRHSTSITSTTPQGYVLGDTGVPGTLGSGPAIWSPSGDFAFVAHAGIPSSIRDREDGNGVNIGWDSGVRYGQQPEIYIDRGGRVLVSHSNFAVVQGYVSSSPKYAFYPGIVPGFPDRAVPLLDVFPQLASIDIDFIHDLASVDGYLYMTLSGSDGTFLFGARDPSVTVPEPAGVVVMLVGALMGSFRRRGRYC